MKTITITLEWGKDGYGVWIEELPTVFSYGQTVDQAKSNAREAIDLLFEQIEAPVWYTEGYEIAVRFDTASLLNHYQHVFTKRALSKITGINESLLSQYAMGIKKPRPTQSKKIEIGLHTLAKELQTVTLL